jgi:hypothetical protein
VSWAELPEDRAAHACVLAFSDEDFAAAGA